MSYTKKTTTAPKKDAINKETDTKVTNESKTTNTPVVEEKIFNPEDTIPCRSRDWILMRRMHLSSKVIRVTIPFVTGLRIP